MKNVLGAFALIFILASPFVAEAREAYRESFDRPLVGKAAQGLQAGKDGVDRSWKNPVSDFRSTDPVFVESPVSFHGATAGSISFDLQRLSDDGAATPPRTVFSLNSPSGVVRFLMLLNWKSDLDPSRTALYFGGSGSATGGQNLWKPAVFLDTPVAVGQWIHVDLFWDDLAGRYDLLVDGRSLVGGVRRADSQKKKFMTFSDIVADVSLVRLGASVFRLARNVEGVGSLNNAALANFSIRVDDGPAPLISSISDDSFKVPGISGKLVAGDTVTVRMVVSDNTGTAAPIATDNTGSVHAVAGAFPGATFDIGRVKGVQMTLVQESPGSSGVPPVVPGTYEGRYTILPGDDFADGQIVGRYLSSDNVAADNAVSASKWTIDTKARVEFRIDRKEMPADSTSTQRIKLVARDANGNVLKGRRLKLTLATTDEYTGLVGAGDFGKEVGAEVEARWSSVTDAFGEMEFDYRAGFAAKTVILQAKDLDSGYTSVDYVTSFKEASIDIALTPVRSMSAARRGVAQFVLKLEASRTELTADGRSRSVLRATLLDPNGNPVVGDPIAFTLSSTNGSIKTISGTTDKAGLAIAEYIAGKKMGIVVVTATASLRGVSANVSITLMADAPAKIYLKATPDKLPADGMSRADVSVKVTDINDNPNRDTKVEFKVVKGGGKVESPSVLTDKLGESVDRYVAGTVPGIATILATVRSKVPSTDEMEKARNVLFVPYSAEGEQVRVQNWLKKKGDVVLRGESIAEYTVGRSGPSNVIVAPFDLTLGDRFVETWDWAETGQSLAIVIPAPVK